MWSIKKNGSVLPLSDIVSVGVYKFEEYEILNDPEDKSGFRKNSCIVGHAKGEKPFEKRKTIIDKEEFVTSTPIEATGIDIVSDRNIFDSLLVLASKTLVSLQKDSDKLIISWCEKYGLPFCSTEASQQWGYFACPLVQFRDFLFMLRDAFLKVESIFDDFSVEHDIDGNLFAGGLVRNPYKRQNNYFTNAQKESLIADFINTAKIRLFFEYQDGKPTLYNYAKDIISLAKYQFALILLSNGESIPRHCKCCNSMFFAYRKNKLYCPYCTRQKRYAAEQRKKKKEGGLEKRG